MFVADWGWGCVGGPGDTLSALGAGSDVDGAGSGKLVAPPFPFAAVDTRLPPERRRRSIWLNEPEVAVVAPTGAVAGGCDRTGECGDAGIGGAPCSGGGGDDADVDMPRGRARRNEPRIVPRCGECGLSG